MILAETKIEWMYIEIRRTARFIIFTIQATSERRYWNRTPLKHTIPNTSKRYQYVHLCCSIHHSIVVQKHSVGFVMRSEEYESSRQPQPNATPIPFIIVQTQQRLSYPIASVSFQLSTILTCVAIQLRARSPRVHFVWCSLVDHVLIHLLVTVAGTFN